MLPRRARAPILLPSSDPPAPRSLWPLPSCGLTPYRSDVRKEEVANFTLSSIADAVGGEQNLMIIGFDPELRKEADEFPARWKQMLQKK